MTKYVAFLDVLGFKETVKKLRQSEAEGFIMKFSSTVYHAWTEKNPRFLNGYIVSDSFIIYTSNTTSEALEELLAIVCKICRDEFSKNGILIRGAIAKGEFERIQAEEITTLKKGLIVGQGYIDAYKLESTVKMIGIALSHDVYEDTNNLGVYTEDILKETINQEERFLLRYLTLDFLREKENLEKFIYKAQEANWLPHYYNTIYMALKRVDNDKKVSQLFYDILEIVCQASPSENWRKIDNYIKGTFSDEVVSEYQKRFLKFIRGIYQDTLNMRHKNKQ